MHPEGCEAAQRVGEGGFVVRSRGLSDSALAVRSDVDFYS